MGRERTNQDLVCEECRDPGQPACGRGTLPLDVVLCDRCWNRLANELAEIDEATDPPGPRIPAHTVECQHPAAQARVEEAWRADRGRQAWVPPSVEEFEDDEG